MSKKEVFAHLVAAAGTVLVAGSVFDKVSTIVNTDHRRYLDLSRFVDKDEYSFEDEDD